MLVNVNALPCIANTRALSHTLNCTKWNAAEIKIQQSWPRCFGELGEWRRRILFEEENNKGEKKKTKQIDWSAFPVEDLEFEPSPIQTENRSVETLALCLLPVLQHLLLTAVRMAAWIWADINSIVINSSIDPAHRYHSSLCCWSFIVICFERRSGSAKHCNPSVFTATGLAAPTIHFIRSPFIHFSLFPTSTFILFFFFSVSCMFLYL